MSISRYARVVFVAAFGVAGCGARGALYDDPGAAGGAAGSCLPACLSDYLATCVAPEGACGGYVAALPNAWRHCFDNGASVTSSMDSSRTGGDRWTVEDRRACLSITRTAAATADVYRLRDRDGRELATVFTGQSLGRRLRVECGGATHAVDPESAACAGDPWPRVLRPFEISCPFGASCRPR